MRLFLIFHLFHLLLYQSDSMICADEDYDDGVEDEQKKSTHHSQNCCTSRAAENKHSQNNKKITRRTRNCSHLFAHSENYYFINDFLSVLTFE